MKTILQVLFGLILCVVGMVVSIYLGLLLNGSPPDLRAAVVLLLLITVSQWISFMAFRRRVVLQVFFGLALCMAIAVWLIHSSLSFSWETRYPDGSNPITWRSSVAFLLLLAITQGISFLTFRWTKLSRRRPPTAAS